MGCWLQYLRLVEHGEFPADELAIPTGTDLLSLGKLAGWAAAGDTRALTRLEELEGDPHNLTTSILEVLAKIPLAAPVHLLDGTAENQPASGFRTVGPLGSGHPSLPKPSGTVPDSAESPSAVLIAFWLWTARNGCGPDRLPSRRSWVRIPSAASKRIPCGPWSYRETGDQPPVCSFAQRVFGPYHFPAQNQSLISPLGLR